MQNHYHQTLSLDRAELAGIFKPVTDKEAWAKFEDGLKDVTSMEEALAWVKKNHADCGKVNHQSNDPQFQR